MKDLFNSFYSKYKSYSSIGKILIFVFITANLFNFLPLKLSDPEWSSNLSLYIVDTSTILLLGFWFINISIIELNKIYFALNTNDLNLLKIDSIALEDFKTKFNLEKIISKKKNLNNGLNITLLLYLLLIVFQFFIYIRGLNVIQLKVNANFNNIDEEIQRKTKSKKINDNEIYLETYKNSLSNFQINSKQAKEIVLESAKIAKFDLLKQRAKVVLLSLIFCLGLKLISII